jgi:hypothetical protein
MALSIVKCEKLPAYWRKLLANTQFIPLGA